MRIISCQVCGSNQHQWLFEGRDRIFGLSGDFTIVKCVGCGLIFMNPQPEPLALKKYYPKDYHESQFVHFREYSELRRKVLETFFGYPLPLNTSKRQKFIHKVVLYPFKWKYRNSIPFVEKGRLLDIGCGNGTELYRLKKMGWEVHGVEIDEEASDRARTVGLPVFTESLFEAKFPDHFFHVVRMSFVLEHLPNPKETLIEIKRILQPQGRIYISIQNARSLNYWLFRERWFSLDVPRHLFSFTPETIQWLLSSLDLEVRSVQFDSGTRTFLASLQYWLNDRFRKGAALQVSQPLLKSHFLKHLSQPFCWLVDRMGLGDLIHLEVVQA